MTRPFVFLLLCALSLSARAAVQASVDKNPVLIGETFTLSIRSESGGDEPELEALSADFQILNRQSSSQFQFINGRSQRQHEWIIALRPKRLGVLRIPPLKLGSEFTQAISITVQAPQQQPGEAPDAFIETELSTTTPYVREQVVLISRLWIRGDVVSGSFSEPGSADALIEQLGEQSESQQLRGAHRYRVIERRYAVFPERSGTLNLQAPVFNGEIATGRQRRSLFGLNPETRALYAAADPIVLEVKPQAAAGGTEFWLPAQAVELGDETIPADGPWRVGEPLTRRVSLRVRGQLHTQLPDLQLDSPAHTQSYAEAPQEQTTASTQGMTALRQYSMAIIPQQPGRLKLPAIRLSWWDTQTDQARVAQLPAREVMIEARPQPVSAPSPAPLTTAPAAASPLAEGAPQPAPSSWLWQVLALTALAGWIGTVLAWFWLGRAPRGDSAPTATPSPVSRRPLLKLLEKAEALPCRNALLQWARQQLGESVALLQLTQYSQDPELAAALAALDAAAYGRGGDFPRQPLLRFVREFKYSAPAPKASALAPLYPD